MLAGARDGAVEFAAGAASAASEAAQTVTNTIGGALGGFASMFARKERANADSPCDAVVNETGESVPEPARPARSMSDVAEELRTLKSLLDEGIISQEDFDAKKAALLGL